MSTTEFRRRALAHRVSGGIQVSLYWDKVDDTLTLVVYDSRSSDYFEIDVPRDRAGRDRRAASQRACPRSRTRPDEMGSVSTRSTSASRSSGRASTR
jgi:hypothetical protein